MLDKKNFYINGQWVAPKNAKDIEVIDPSTEKSCAIIFDRITQEYGRRIQKHRGQKK